jgi:DNA polymerase/3'-5' exonuclease PolX
MKTKRPLAVARAAAEQIVALLAPACERIEIAGSLRRECAYVGDIELVAIPKTYVQPVDLFGMETERLSELDDRLNALAVHLTKDGKRYKQFSWPPATSDYQVDLFIADADNWAYILMLRTGDAAFSKSMVTPHALGGLKPDPLYLAGGYVQTQWPHKVIPVPDEEELFRLWNLDYVPPAQRTSKNELP